MLLDGKPLIYFIVYRICVLSPLPGWFTAKVNWLYTYINTDNPPENNDSSSSQQTSLREAIVHWWLTSVNHQEGPWNDACLLFLLHSHHLQHTHTHIKCAHRHTHLHTLTHSSDRFRLSPDYPYSSLWKPFSHKFTIRQQTSTLDPGFLPSPVIFGPFLSSYPSSCSAPRRVEPPH